MWESMQEGKSYKETLKQNQVGLVFWEGRDKYTGVPRFLNIVRSGRLFEFQNIWKPRLKWWFANSIEKIENKLSGSHLTFTSGFSAFKNRNVRKPRYHCIQNWEWAKIAELTLPLNSRNLSLEHLQRLLPQSQNPTGNLCEVLVSSKSV